MGIGVSLILIAVGAVLTFAVHATTSGSNAHTVGYIWSSRGGVGGRRTIAEEGAPARRRTVVEDEVA